MRTLTLWCILLCMFVHTAAAQKPDRSAPPKLGPPPALRLGEIQHLKLSNGIPVILYEKHSVPLVQVNLFVRAGIVDDPEGKPGLASMTASMMMEGAGRRNSLELADAVEFLGAQLVVNAGYHSFGVSLNTPTARIDSALALMADVALRPGFPEEELNRKRKERLTALLQWRDEPRMLASVLFNRSLFGAHPYGVPTIGTEHSLESFTTGDLKSFHAQHFGSNTSTLIVVGDATARSIMPKLEAAFGKWKPAKAATPALPEIAQVGSRRILLVDKPGAPQSEIRIGRIGVPRLTDDYFAITVMNTILGGSFSSRLNQNLREKHGYTYGAGSRFDFRPFPGPFVASAGVQTAVTDSSLIEFMKELRGILQTIPPEEVARARNYLALSYPTDFQTISQVASKLEDLVMYNLPDDYFNRYIDNILSVSPGDVERVAKKYIDPDHMLIVVVGDRQQIEKKIEALNIGPLTVMSVDDVLGKAPALGSRE